MRDNPNMMFTLDEEDESDYTNTFKSSGKGNSMGGKINYIKRIHESDDEDIDDDDIAPDDTVGR
jgi:hypothetical protein